MHCKYRNCPQKRMISSTSWWWVMKHSFHLMALLPDKIASFGIVKITCHAQVQIAFCEVHCVVCHDISNNHLAILLWRWWSQCSDIDCWSISKYDLDYYVSYSGEQASDVVSTRWGNFIQGKGFNLISKNHFQPSHHLQKNWHKLALSIHLNLLCLIFFSLELSAGQSLCKQTTSNTELKDNIHVEIRSFRSKVLTPVMNHVPHRIPICEVQNGRHLTEIILFHT